MRGTSGSSAPSMHLRLWAVVVAVARRGPVARRGLHSAAKKVPIPHYLYIFIWQKVNGQAEAEGRSGQTVSGDGGGGRRYTKGRQAAAAAAAEGRCTMGKPSAARGGGGGAGTRERSH